MTRISDVFRRPGGYRLLEAVVSSVLMGVLSAGGVGLVASMFGAARPKLVVPLALAIWLALLAAWRPDRTARPDLGRTVPMVAVLLGVAIILGSGAINARYNGQYVRTDRDNGIYTTMAFWMAEHGDVFVDGRGDVLDGVAGVNVDTIGQAYRDRSPDRSATEKSTLEVHGTHLVPVLWAEGQWVGGTAGMQVMPSMIGSIALAAFFLLGLWYLPAWAAVASTAALAANFIFVYGVRANLTEPTSLLFFAGGLWFVLAATRGRSLMRYAIAGALPAATLAARIDGGVAIAALPIAIGFAVQDRPSDENGSPSLRYLVLLLGALVMGAVGFADLLARSPGYASDLGSEVSLVMAALVTGIVLGAAVLGIGATIRRGGLVRVRGLVERNRTTLQAAAMAVIGFFFVFLWFIRPLLGRSRQAFGKGGASVMAGIQRSEGFDRDGFFSYADVSVDRIAWYVGPIVVALAVAGTLLMVRRLGERKHAREAALLLAGVLPTTFLYLWKPSIFPDQPWMMRRYLPVVLPGLLILAAFAGSEVVRWLRTAFDNTPGRQLVLAVAAVVVAVLVLSPLRVTRPLWRARWQAGGYHGIQRVCDTVGPDAVVLLSNERHTAATLMASIRGICDVPTGRPSDQPERRVPATELSALMKERGRSLWAVAPTIEDLDELAPGHGEPVEIEVFNTLQVVPTLNHAPSEYRPHRVAVFVAPVEP